MALELIIVSHTFLQFTASSTFSCSTVPATSTFSTIPLPSVSPTTLTSPATSTFSTIPLPSVSQTILTSSVSSTSSGPVRLPSMLFLKMPLPPVLFLLLLPLVLITHLQVIHVLVGYNYKCVTIWMNTFAHIQYSIYLHCQSWNYCPYEW